MKRSVTILMAVMLLTLTACGRRNNDPQTTTDPPTAQQEMAPDSSVGTEGADGVLPGSGDTSVHSDSARPHDDDAADGGDSGVSYEQMLRNGRVHDSDGRLRDGENSVSGNTAENAVKDAVRSTKDAVKDMMD